MKFYHGSKEIIKEPSYKGSEPSNDYGASFYMTTDLEAAKSWACKNNSVGIVNEYEVKQASFDKLRILDLTNKDKYSVLNWIAILMHFRTLDPSFIRNNRLTLEYLEKYYIDVDSYDVIKGFRADDAYFKFPLKFISNDLSIEDLEDIFLSGNLGIQYAFMSKKALKTLKFKKIIECDEKYLMKHFYIVKAASEEFNELLIKERNPKKQYILDLMREEDE